MYFFPLKKEKNLWFCFSEHHRIEPNKQANNVEVTASLDLRDENAPHHHSCEVLTKKVLTVIAPARSSPIFIWPCERNEFHMHACKPVEIGYDSSVYTECIWNASAFPNHMWLTGTMQIAFSFSASKSAQYGKFWYTGNCVDPIRFLCEQI